MADSALTIPAEMYAWSRLRSGHTREYLTDRIPGFPQWESGEASPTLAQLKEYAEVTYTPIGYFFLPEPPAEGLPIPDFRHSAEDRGVEQPRADLLDTIYQAQRRQDWYTGYALMNHLSRVDLAGAFSVNSDPSETASRVKEALGWENTEQTTSSRGKLQRLADKAEQVGVLVMFDNKADSNPCRGLNPEEFQGFALVDDFAPVVFVNGAAAEADQMFALARGLVHIAAGKPGLYRSDLSGRTENRTEIWFNTAAAEMLIPMSVLLRGQPPAGTADATLDQAARRFGVSTLVILRRLYDAGYLSHQAFEDAFRSESRRLSEKSDVGNVCIPLPERVSKTFLKAVIPSTLMGETMYRDAFQMLGIKKQSVFKELATEYQAEYQASLRVAAA